MKVVVQWSGGKECCLALYKALKLGHEVTYLITYIYKKPYIFHSLPVMELQSQTLGIPQVKVKVKKSYEDIFKTLDRLRKEEGIEGFVTGDISEAGCARVHKIYYDIICEKLGITMLMPLENPSGNTYDILKEEISSGIRPMLTCINSDYFSEEWLGRLIDKDSIKELKALADEQMIDVCSEDGKGYHSMVIDAPNFKDTIEINKFKKKTRDEKSKTWKRHWLYMDIQEARLKLKTF